MPISKENLRNFRDAHSGNNRSYVIFFKNTRSVKLINFCYTLKKKHQTATYSILAARLAAYAS